MKTLRHLVASFVVLFLIVGLCACSQTDGSDRSEKKSSSRKEKTEEKDTSGTKLVTGDDRDDIDQTGDDKEKDGDEEDMAEAELLYLGHASVRIVTPKGKVIYIDPYAGEDYGEPADLVLVTHYHYDHYGMDKIKKNSGCKVIEPADALKKGKYQSFEEHGVKIKAVPAYNSNHNKSECVGYILEFDGIKLYHAGDTSKIPEMADLAGENLDYALLPMDDVYNMGPEEAEECADMIKAARYIPIHTGPDGVFSEENIDRFNPGWKVIVKPGETITLSR